MKILSLIFAICLNLSPESDIQPPRGPEDYHRINCRIGLYGEKKHTMAELWQHNRLPYQKAVIRYPYQEVYVEDDGTIIMNDDYDSWGEYYPKSKLKAD